jgi:hypothetical protein
MSEQMRLGKTDAPAERLLARMGEATLRATTLRELVNSL